MISTRTLLFLALTGISTTTFAAGDPPSPAVFVSKAAQDGMTEVELGKVALAKSKDAKVREFAQRMVTDHGKANHELAAIARQKGLEAPKSLDTEHQNMVQKLESQSGEAFDLEYSTHMNMDHSKAIELFEATTQSSDPDLAGFARKTLPTLKEHKKLAAKLPGQ
jgi:putative membrane protein